MFHEETIGSLSVSITSSIKTIQLQVFEPHLNTIEISLSLSSCSPSTTSAPVTGGNGWKKKPLKEKSVKTRPENCFFVISANSGQWEEEREKLGYGQFFHLFFFHCTLEGISALVTTILPTYLPSFLVLLFYLSSSKTQFQWLQGSPSLPSIPILSSLPSSLVNNRIPAPFSSLCSWWLDSGFGKT